jgi:S-adenosylmethionine:tRNA ribosyltransferase-isomerase
MLIFDLDRYDSDPKPMTSDDRDSTTLPLEYPPDPDRSLSAYDYVLPEERIAQNPVVPRDRSRLLVIESPTTHTHHQFFELPHLLRSGDLLVFNNTRVIPARLYGRKVGGAQVEVLLLEEKGLNRWLALVRPGRRLKPGAEIEFQSGTDSATLRATILETDPETSGRIIDFQVPDGRSLLSILDEFGEIPLPPYITETMADPEQYQTVYANRPGAVAAPTAGLHFTPEVLQALTQIGVNQQQLTLHVGVGTFRPVESENILEHQMHGEWLDVSAELVAAIAQTKAKGGRVFAVGTTVVRALEGAAATGPLTPFCGKTNLFIYPGYQWQVVDGLITNFHLPKSSLMMLVSALIGRERLLALYETAIAEQYRFYSFGDAMLILPEARIDREFA